MLWKSTETHPKLSILKKQKACQFGEDWGRSTGSLRGIAGGPPSVDDLVWILCCALSQPRVFSLSPFRLSPRPTGGGGASERSRGASLPAGVRPRHELMLRRGSLRGCGCCCAASEEAALRAWLSLPPLGMPLTAAASGLRGLSLPGLPLRAAREHKGTGGALTGCGQELLRLKLERPEKGREEEMEGRPAGSCLPLQARESLPLRVWKDPSS
ncbi:uncharacterized protein LOC115333957 isoform X2 [Aquila chrysaetos chrysaetos]|uniref:uncharacterized protein LOC115333957 isoform X2 n=1 Tax=Aquila chrysaetos chrysaetos TaxID=223781 RepID=UPI001B7D3B30|nr:uncharacterized protein LOC115333957 isoform X2 [Aquila chrysaetos chrysaetos]